MLLNYLGNALKENCICRFLTKCQNGRKVKKEQENQEIAGKS
jgi:hypothetical protein